MIYVFDLDGTICTQEKDYHKAKPLKKRIIAINLLYDAGHTIYIDTARGSVSGKNHTQFTALQLLRWGVKYHKLRCGVKLFANLYIDDHAMKDNIFFDER